MGGDENRQRGHAQINRKVGAFERNHSASNRSAMKEDKPDPSGRYFGRTAYSVQTACFEVC